MSQTQIPHAGLSDLLEWWRSAWDIFQSHWWLWILFGILQFAAVMPTVKLPRLWSVVSRYLLAAGFSFTSAILVISFISKQSFEKSLLDRPVSIVVGVILFTTWLFLVNRFVEVPILKLFANEHEQAIYAGNLKDAEIAPRWWVDVIHFMWYIFPNIDPYAYYREEL
jgi:signal transduction histidine kinase